MNLSVDKEVKEMLKWLQNVNFTDKISLKNLVDLSNLKLELKELQVVF